MAVKLIANYSKRLGLPGYSSHQFSVSVETEVLNVDDVQGESRRLYDLLQTSVDREIQTTGFVPPDGYGMQTNGAGSPDNGNGLAESNGADNGRWNCSDKQRQFIERLVGEHNLDRKEIDQLAHDRFGKGVRALNKLEMSGLLDELLERTDGNNGNGRPQRANGNGRARSAYARNGGAR